MKIITTIFLLTINSIIFSQENTQTLRGRVTDAFTGSPLIGSVIEVSNSNPQIASFADTNGNFELKNIPLGRCEIKASFLGYKEAYISNIMLISGKESIINIKLEEHVTELHEIVIKNSIDKSKALNDMAFISARTFSKEETERFAGSLGDPARMVANYAGVMAGNDSRNDIVIRGNSPTGVLWRIEGVEISNPNHFGAQGTTGGAVSMLNSNLLSNSDFITGAFPSEYGNAISGVFDLNMRSGNISKHEHTAQVGFNGFELATEGPISMGKENLKGSYLVDYRYSTLDLMNKMGADLGTGTAIPKYQDLSMIIDLPTKKAGRFKLVGIAGKSKIGLGRDFDKQEALTTNDYGSAVDFSAKMAFGTITHQYLFNKNAKLKSAISYNYTSSTTVSDTIDYTNKKYFNNYEGILGEHKLAAQTQFKYRFSKKSNITTGLVINEYITNFKDSAWNENLQERIIIRDINNKNSILTKLYTNYQQHITSSIILNTGLYSQHYNLNNENSIEPRASLKLEISPSQSINIGYGHHSQLQSRLMYYNKELNEITGQYSELNKDLKSTKSNHYIIGYDKNMGRNFRIKAEAYYQHQYDVPVSETNTEYSALNLGGDYYLDIPDSLTNNGLGENIGLEFTIEKFLDKGYYFLLTASIFDSKYRGYDQVWRNTTFNTNYVMNFLGGYEWKIAKKNYLTLDLKTTWSGGRRSSPIDIAKSIETGQTKFDNTKINSAQFDDYFRTDIRIGYKLNGKHITQEWALDLQNITNHQNYFSQSYNKYTQTISTVYQQGFMPMMLYRINF